MAKSTEPRQFAGKPIPKGVTHWTIRRADGSPCRVLAPDGAQHEQFAIEELSAELITQAWGPGDFELGWLAEEDGVRRPVGARRAVTLSGAPSAAPEPAPPPPPPTVPASPQAMGGLPGIPPELAGAFSLMAHLESMAAQKLQTTMQTVATMMSNSGGGGQVAGVLTQLVASQQTTNALLTRLLERDDEEEDEEDDDDGEELPTDVAGLVDWAKEKGVLELAKVVDSFGADDAGKLLAFLTPHFEKLKQKAGGA